MGGFPAMKTSLNVLFAKNWSCLPNYRWLIAATLDLTAHKRRESGRVASMDGQPRLSMQKWLNANRQTNDDTKLLEKGTDFR